MNCFRSLYLWVDLQLQRRDGQGAGVVNCFRSLYLWVDLQHVRIYSGGINVVNCFRSLYLWVDLQRYVIPEGLSVSCELLSFFVPLG